MKKVIITLAIIVVAALVVFIIFNSISDNPSPSEPQIGSNGCFPDYEYDTELNICLQDWVIDTQEKRDAIESLLESEEPYPSLTVISVTPRQCEGCFVVKLTDETLIAREVVLDNWLVVEDPNFVITEEQCEELNGRVIVQSEDVCNPEETLAAVDSPNQTLACCIPAS